MFRVWGSGFRGFRLGFRDCLGFGDKGLGSGFRVKGLGVRV